TSPGAAQPPARPAPAPVANAPAPTDNTPAPTTDAPPADPASPSTTPAAPSTTPAGFASTRRPNSTQAAAIRTACQSDFQASCLGLSPGSAAAWTCLTTNVANFAPDCQRALYAVIGGGPAGAPAGAADPAPVAAPARAPFRPAMSLRQELYLMRVSC